MLIVGDDVLTCLENGPIGTEPLGSGAELVQYLAGTGMKERRCTLARYSSRKTAAGALDRILRAMAMGKLTVDVSGKTLEGTT